MRIACLALVVLAGCPKSGVANGGGVELTPEVLQSTPRLPSPRAGTYARVKDLPADPVIASLVEGLVWDASLSGAAAGLALEAAEGNVGLYSWEIREAAWDAGYPYPVSQVRGWSTPQAAPPPEDLVAWLTTLDDGVDLGLVRARSARGDAWIALVAEPRVSVGLQPRQAELGDEVVLPAIPGARYTVVDATGRLYEGSLELQQPFTLDITGEWLFQVSDAAGVAAKFPIYVDMVPPDLALLTASDAPADEEALVAHARDVLLDVRESYGLPSWEHDLLLEAAAKAALEGDLPEASELASRVGFAADRMWRLECHAATVEDCVDRLIWNPYHRSALLTDSRYWGLAAEREQPGIRIVALVAAE